MPIAFLGTGTLSIGGSTVALLKDVSYQVEMSIYEHKTGIPATVKNRVVQDVNAKLTASYGDVTANHALFIQSGAPGEELTISSNVVFRTHNGDITVTFPQAHIIPTGDLKFSSGEWCIGGLEVRSVDTPPNVS